MKYLIHLIMPLSMPGMLVIVALLAAAWPVLSLATTDNKFVGMCRYISVMCGAHH